MAAFLRRFMSIITDLGMLTHKFEFIAESVEMRNISQPQDEENAGVWDGQDRKLIFAFPPGRANTTHVHTQVHTKWEKKLGEWSLPEEVQESVDVGDTSSKLNPWSTEDGYRKRLHDLLYIEEAAQIKMMRRFDLRAALFVEDKDPSTQLTVYRIDIPGLSERRPSVLVHAPLHTLELPKIR